MTATHVMHRVDVYAEKTACTRTEGFALPGLGGSMRYRDGANMYTEREMSKRMRKLSRKVRMVGGCDILLTHAPAAGMGDLDDRRIEDSSALTQHSNPGIHYMVHGHVHQSYGCDFQRERQHACGTTIINACGYTQFELDQTRYPIRGWQAAWLNSQTTRRELRRHDAIESSTARTPGNHLWKGRCAGPSTPSRPSKRRSRTKVRVAPLFGATWGTWNRLAAMP